MPKKQAARPPLSDSDPYFNTEATKRIIKTVERICQDGKVRPYEAFRRFVEIADAAARAGGRPGPAEDEYMQHVKWFGKEQIQAAAEGVGTLWMAAWPNGFSTGDDQPPDFRDHLGNAYMIITEGDTHAGQYFTPWPVAKMMADMTMGNRNSEEWANATPEKPITVCDPACGSGVMLLAAASASPWRAVKAHKIAFYGMDIDACCVHMARLNMWTRGLNTRWPWYTLIGDSLAGIGGVTEEVIEASRALAPHGKIPPEEIERRSCKDMAAVSDSFDRFVKRQLDGGGIDPLAAPPAPRVAKVAPRKRQLQGV